MNEALAELKSDYRLIALSNTMEIHWTHLMETYSIFQHLNGWVLSYLEGTIKPRPEIYARLQRRYCGNAPRSFLPTTPGPMSKRPEGWAGMRPFFAGPMILWKKSGGIAPRGSHRQIRAHVLV